MTYAEQYRDPRWQRKRLEVFERADWCCELCGDGRTMLQVHHLRYIRGRMLWEYPLDDLCCLCEPCHDVQPRTARELERVGGIVPSVLASATLLARLLGRRSREWSAILRRFGVEDLYDERVCVVCWAAPRIDLTRCADCRSDSPLPDHHESVA